MVAPEKLTRPRENAQAPPSLLVRNPLQEGSIWVRNVSSHREDQGSCRDVTNALSHAGHAAIAELFRHASRNNTRKPWFWTLEKLRPW